MDMPAEHLIITANNRLARSLQLDHARAQVRAGKLAWEQPAILTWQAWLAECHQRLALLLSEPVPLLLTQTQSEALWQWIISHTQYGAALLRPGDTAKRAAQAWELLQAYGVTLDQVQADGSADVGAFVAWAGRYQAHCNERRWVDAARLASWLKAVLEETSLALPARIELRGFDELTPQENALLETVKQQGVRIETPAFPQRRGHAQVRALPDANAEIRMAAAQTRRWLEAKPGARIGIVVPALEARRSALSRALEAALTPAARLHAKAPAHPPFNLSLGSPLAQTGLVADALIGLELMQGALDWQDAGRLLRSRYFAGFGKEAGARARMDASLREAGGARWSLRALERAAESQGAMLLRAALLACKNAAPEGSDSPGAWAQHFSDWLEQLGWCRGVSLSSRDEQTRQAWFELLHGFASLASVAGAMNFHQALEGLRDLAGATPFQPQSADAPVQVMGLLEAAGLEFDCLWVMGLEDSVWPQPANPNPFLPYPLQRQHQMPHASAARELAYSQRIMSRLLGSADDIVLSWPQRDGDKVLAPSALLPATDAAETGLPALHWPRREGWLEVFDDRIPPPVPAGPVQGGSRVLTDQSACPFRAFAAHRLDADPLEQPQAALNAADRGRLVHHALKVLWDDLETQERLLQLDARSLNQRVTAAVRDACRRLQRHTPPLPESFWQLEQQRLERLLASWLEVEKQRAPFTARGREQALTLTLAGLELDLQIDRRDVLAEGGAVVVDYKTGGKNRSPAAWVGARPEEPQLPGYALALDAQGTQLGGLAFAQVRPREPRFNGVTALPDQLPEVRAVEKWSRRPEDCDDLATLVDYWRDQLTGLATAYQEGMSDTDPRRAAECRYCHRQVLCRVREVQNGLKDDEGDTDE